MDIYTRKGDDGTTGLLYGGRVRKDDPAPAAYGDVDEAQSAIGVARAHAAAAVPDGAHVADTADELVQLLVRIERDLWVAMSELATASGNRHKLSAGTSLVTESMVSDLEATIDDVMGRFEAPREFVVPELIRSATAAAPCAIAVRVSQLAPFRQTEKSPPV